MDEILDDITIGNLQVNDTLEIENLIQPENKNVISIGNKLTGSFILKNIEIGYEQVNMNTHTIINGTKSRFLSELNNNSNINIHYKYRSNDNYNIVHETSFKSKVKYIIDDYLILIDTIFDSVEYHEYYKNENEKKQLSKNNLLDSLYLQVEIVPDVFVYNLSQTENSSIINITSFKPSDVEIYLPTISGNLSYEINIINKLKSFNIITNDNNFIGGSFILNSENLFYQSIDDDENISSNNKYISKSILISSSNNYNNKSTNLYISDSTQGLLSGNLKLFNINNNDWNINGQMLGNLYFLNKIPEVLTNVYGFKNEENSLDKILKINFNINNNQLTHIDSDDKYHLQIVNNIIKIYNNNNNNNTILLNKHFKYLISFKTNNQIITDTYYIRFFYLKIDNRYDTINEVSLITTTDTHYDGVVYNNNILDISRLQKYNKIYYIILKSLSDIININDDNINIVSQGIININDTNNSFYIKNIKDLNDEINTKLVFPNPYYNVYNPFISLSNTTHNTYYNNNLININSDLENNGKGFYKIRNSDDTKFYPLYFLYENSNTNSNDQSSITYGPYSYGNDKFMWKNKDFINYYMPNLPIQTYKYNPYYTDNNNIKQYYLPDDENFNPDTIIVDTIVNSSIGETYINLSWKKHHIELDVRNNIKNYIVQSYLNNTWITVGNPTTNSFNYINLLSNTEYKIRIAARNQLDYISNYTTLSPITTKISTVLNILPNIIKNLQYTSNINTIVLTWEKPLDNNSGDIIGYNIDIYDTNKWINIVSLTTDLFYIIKNLLPNTFYKFRINATNNAGNSNYTITDSSLKTQQ